MSKCTTQHTYLRGNLRVKIALPYFIMKSDYYTPTVISSEYMTNKFNNIKVT